MCFFVNTRFDKTVLARGNSAEFSDFAILPPNGTDVSPTGVGELVDTQNLKESLQTKKRPRPCERFGI